MKILAIESATVTASCAISEDDKILGAYSLSHKRTHSEKLMPLIEQLMEDTGTIPQELALIAISKGPGSYTGLRIGAAIGKSMAYALNIPIAGVPTMMAMAANIYDLSACIVPVMDSRGGRVYSGIYRYDDGRLKAVMDQFPADIDELISLLNNRGDSIILNGDGSVIYEEKLKQELTCPAIIAPMSYGLLDAGKSALLGYMFWQQGLSIKADEFFPEYLRLSQAERNKKI